MKTVIVTGGTFGIGKAITLALAENEFNVVAFGLEPNKGMDDDKYQIDTLSSELNSANLKVDIIEADVTKSSDINEVAKFTREKYGRIDGLVNNAAIGPLGSIVETSEKMWDDVINVNLKGTFLCCKEVLHYMIEQGEGAIVNIGSGSGWGKPNMLAYSASKGGIFALSAAMAYDHMRHGIRVNTVVPGGGGFVTGMSLERRNGNIKNILDNGINNADNRLTEPSDVANAVLFLLSDKATAISGTIIDVGCFAGQGGPLNNFKASQHE